MFKKLFSKSENNDGTVLIEGAQTAKQEGATHVIQNERRVGEAGPSVTFYRQNEGKVESAWLEFVGGKKAYLWATDPKKWAEKGLTKPFWVPVKENIIPSNAKPIDEVIARGSL
jgi:hypothetical protein